MPSSWTLQAASGGTEQSLAAWGFSSPTRSSAVQAEDTLTLSLPVADAAAASDLWAWETELIIRRDGDVYYRGYLDAPTRRFTPDGEVIDYPLRNQWWLLARLTYLQTWDALTGSAMGTIQTGRVRLGATTATRSLSAMVAQLEAYAATMGITLSINLSELGEQDIPAIEGHNRTVADLLREMFRWFPDVALVPVYTEAGTTFRARLSSSTPVEIIDVGDRPLSALDIRPMPELQVDAVKVIYEATAAEGTYEAGDDGAGFVATDRLVGAADTYPVGATITRRSLVITLPYPAPPGDAGAPAPSSPVPNIAKQSIVAETWPTNGATDTVAQQWWLDRSSLGILGLTAADILINPTADATIKAHRVTIDPATIAAPPSAVNPNSTPVWRPAAATDTPREIISGGITDWMSPSLKAYSLIAEVTIAVKKSAVTAMSAENKAAFLRLGPREKTIGAYPAYLLDALYKFTGTNATTKVYSKVVSIDYGSGSGSSAAVAAAAESAALSGGASAEAAAAAGAAAGSAAAASSNESNYNEAVARAVIPNLAQRLYEARSPLNYEGSIPLTRDEAPLTSYLGRRICLAHADRPEWATMAAQVSQESIDLDAGRVTLTFGPPLHLDAADWGALHAAARSSQDRRATAASAPQPVQNPSPDPGDEEDPEPPRNAVIGSSLTPEKQFQWQNGGTTKRPWDIVPDGDTTFKLYDPRVIWKRSDVTASITVTNTAFTPAADKYLVAKIDSLSAPAISIELLSTGWTDYPEAYEFTGAGNDFTSARLPLWEPSDAETEGAIEIIADVWMKKVVASDVLRLVFPLYNIPSTTVLRTVPDLL